MTDLVPPGDTPRVPLPKASASPSEPRRVDWGRWAIVVAVPVAAYVVGFVALPRPQAVAAEQQKFDRSGLGTAVSTTPTDPNSKVDVTLGGFVVVRGADVPTTSLSRGARLPIAVHFAVPAGEGGVDGDYQVFLHIDAQDSGGGAASAYRIHGDHWPVRGQYKTPYWRPGEFIVDKWEGTVPMDAPAGVYDVWAGLYRGDDRVSVTAGNRKFVDADDRVRVGQITIE